MIDFNNLLELAGIEPSQTLLARHVPVEKSLRGVLPWLIVERPDLWLAYQRIQWQTLEKAMTRGAYIASFIGQKPTKATYAGFYRIGGWQTLDADGYRTFPGNGELEELGMSGRAPDMPDCLAFELEPLDHYANYVGRLIVDWPLPYQQWWRWGGRAALPVSAIAEESLFVEAMPDWKDLALSWSELHNLPTSWRRSLAQWRGIYFIQDTRSGKGYVGSAYGSDNLLGRWMDYAKSGDGGNVEMRTSKPEDLRFSILQRTDPDAEAGEVIALESSWKRRLFTREFGLNGN